MGSFYFFAESLTELQMRRISQLGMDVYHEIDTTAINKRLLSTQSAETTLEPLSSSAILSGVGSI
jgi:hypothetical protein